MVDPATAEPLQPGRRQVHDESLCCLRVQQRRLYVVPTALAPRQSRTAYPARATLQRCRRACIQSGSLRQQQSAWHQVPQRVRALRTLLGLLSKTPHQNAR